MSYCSRFPQLLQLPAGIALVICTVGGSGLIEHSVSEQSTGKQLIKASLINFLITYICLFLLTAKSARENGSLRSGEPIQHKQWRCQSLVFVCSSDSSRTSRQFRHPPQPAEISLYGQSCKSLRRFQF
ncbi:hypothetical protein BDR22DRAFT_260591 [Usnea florida]